MYDKKKTIIVFMKFSFDLQRKQKNNIQSEQISKRLIIMMEHLWRVGNFTNDGLSLSK